MKLQFDKTENTLIWIDGSGNLSDAFTKDKSECRQPLEIFLRIWEWMVRYDPDFVVSQKKAEKAVRILAERPDSHFASQKAGAAGPTSGSG